MDFENTAPTEGEIEELVEDLIEYIEEICPQASTIARKASLKIELGHRLRAFFGLE